MGRDRHRIDAFFISLKVPQELSQSRVDADVSKTLTMLFSQHGWDRVTASSGYGGEIVYQVYTPGRMSDKNMADFYYKLEILFSTHKEFLPSFAQKEEVSS